MDIYVVGRSAIMFYRELRDLVEGKRPLRVTRSLSCVSNVADFDAVVKGFADTRLRRMFEHRTHLLVDDESRRVRSRLSSREIVNHIWTGPLPPNAFVPICEGLKVASPAFAAATVACELERIELTLLIMELCGYFAYAPETEQGFIRREPLTRLSSMQRMSANLKGMNGLGTLRHAVKWALESSYSPAESELAVKMHIPRHYGGYGVPGIVMNSKLELSTQAARIAGRRFLRPDLYCPRAKLDMEYDSAAWHALERNHIDDSRRRDALACMNVEVVSITNEQMRDDRAFHEIAMHVARRTKTHVRPDDAASRAARYALDRSLLRIRNRTGVCQGE